MRKYRESFEKTWELLVDEKTVRSDRWTGDKLIATTG
jgi:hypothetical protein